MNHVIGLDIGGANLKAAHSDGACRSRAFPMWKHPEKLADAIREIIDGWLPCRALAVTMTGELADCFTTKEEGVARILDAVEEVAGMCGAVIWQTAGEFVPIDVAREFWQLTAAANWHALTSFVARAVPNGFGLLLDIGSTTTDIIPFEHGLPISAGLNDGERLASGELVYCGVQRTPLCALAAEVSWRGGRSRVAAELFATTRDAYLLLGDLPEEPSCTDTANGRPATRAAAYDRIVRMLCCDRNEVSLDEATQLAQQFAELQQQRITEAIDEVLQRQSSRCDCVVISGSGSFLAERTVSQHPHLKTVERLRLASMFSPEVAEAACAFAVARLAAAE